MDLKTNTGAIFKNDKKTNDKAPDYRGKIDVDGVEKEIALWVRESQKGTKFFSVKISDPYKPNEKTEDNLTTAREIAKERQAALDIDKGMTDDDGLPFILTIPIVSGLLIKITSICGYMCYLI